ncbi:CPK2 [Symbiodinium necroappetens]|uniref:CPK2 protein n=1 Tax=Symbiodinium necroappetens TaxID=1628268 RepID=A0A812PRQ5_9DINO|nr:CPK2 [Symbiodinium necroappetens]
MAGAFPHSLPEVETRKALGTAASYIRGLAELLCADGMCMVVSNMPARHRHLADLFQIAEVVKLHPEEEPFGPCLYICRRRNSDAEIEVSKEEMYPAKEKRCFRQHNAAMRVENFCLALLFLFGLRGECLMVLAKKTRHDLSCLRFAVCLVLETGGMGGCGSKSRVEATQPKASKAPEPQISNLHSDPSGQPIDAGAGHNAGTAKAAKQLSPAKGDLSKLQAPADDVQLVLSAGDIRDKYEILAVLGSGSFGEVKEIRVKAFPDKLRAVKITERQVDDKGEKGQKKLDSLAMFRKEVELLRSLKHPNIVRVWDVYETSHYLYVVMDLCRGGELFEMINEMDRLSESDTAVIAKQLLGGIDYMHSKGVMHRDIKAENVLLTEWSPTAVVKIIDFGIAARFQRGEMFDKISGSPQYMAPELVGQRYDYRVDMWAFGVLVYFALYGRYPFDGNNVREILLTVLHGTIEWDSDVSIDSKTIAFLKGCLNRKPRKRTTAKAAMSHPWIMSAKKPDAEKHREPTEINISSDILKGDPKNTTPGTEKKATAEKPETAKDDGGKRSALRVRQDDPSAAAGIGQEATGSQGATEEEGQVDFMLDPNQALEFQDMYSDWKRQTSTDSTASSHLTQLRAG